MKLFQTKLSPFCRKIVIALHALDLESKVELVEVALNPVERNPAFEALNPLRKIPAFEDAQGRYLYDSRVILEYLDIFVGGSTLLPADPGERIAVLRRQALADGITDAAVALRYELHMRPAELHWQPWIEAQTGRVLRGFEALEREAAELDGLNRADQIAVACAFDYVRFRFPQMTEITAHRGLAAFMEQISRQPIMQRTDPR